MRWVWILFHMKKKIRVQWEKSWTQVLKDIFFCPQIFSPEDFESFLRAKIMKDLKPGRYLRKLKLNPVPTIFIHNTPKPCCQLVSERLW